MLLVGPGPVDGLRGSFWHVWSVIWLIGALWLSSLGGLLFIADFSSWPSTASTGVIALGTLSGAAFWSRKIAALL